MACQILHNGGPFMLMNIENSINVYIAWKATHRTVAPARYEVRLRGLKNYLGSDTEIETITGDKIVEYFNFMKTELMYSNTTVVYCANIIKNFFEFWSHRTKLSLYPKEIIRPKGKKYYRPAVSLTDFKEMGKCLSEDNFTDVMQKLVVNILWDTGMRVSELCDLNLADIIQDREQSFFGATISRRKTLRNNLVLWGSETNRLLILYLGMRLAVIHPTDALFISGRKASAGRICSRTVQRWVKMICEMANTYSSYTPHSFRHGKAHHMLNQRANIRDVQEVLGHSTPVSTFHYLSLNQTQFMDVAKKYVERGTGDNLDPQGEHLSENQLIHSPSLQWMFE